MQFRLVQRVIDGEDRLEIQYLGKWRDLSSFWFPKWIDEWKPYGFMNVDSYRFPIEQKNKAVEVLKNLRRGEIVLED